MNCHIRSKSHLDPSWQEWFVGLDMAQSREGTTVLSGPLEEQTALYGVMTKIRSLGLTLLSLETSKEG